MEDLAIVDDIAGEEDVRVSDAARAAVVGRVAVCIQRQACVFQRELVEVGATADGGDEVIEGVFVFLAIGSATRDVYAAFGVETRFEMLDRQRHVEFGTERLPRDVLHRRIGERARRVPRP